jgi:PAS domain S-box-containing protein
MTILNPDLRTSPFLSGVVTILIFAYLALRARLKLVAEARESHLQARRALDATFEGIAIHNGKILIYVNDAMCDMFGYTRKEMVGHSFHSFVTPESIQLADRQIAAQFENVYELIGIKKDGTRFPMEVRGKKHILADGSVGRIAALHDLTDKRKHEQSKILYEASQEALKLRNEFISIASHELKTPLTSIKLQTQMTNIKFRKGDTSALSSEHIKKFVDQIDRQADRLTNLVEDMLDVSRISLGKLVLEKEVTVLNDLIKETLESLNEIIKQNGNQIICDFEPNVIAAVDRFRIEQVMTNLLTNAIKYGEGKPITITLKKHHQRVEFSICDQGMGIAQENQERIFARFERAVAAKNISGLGLGLYISQQIVQSHNGQIIVKSAPHEGACFTVILPAH